MNTMVAELAYLYILRNIVWADEKRAALHQEVNKLMSKQASVHNSCRELIWYMIVLSLSSIYTSFVRQQFATKARGARPITPFVLYHVLGMGELRLPSSFSYESEERVHAFLSELRLEVLVERVLLEKAVCSGRRLLHTHDITWGSITFTIEFSRGRKSFRIAMTVKWGANKSAAGMESYYMVRLCTLVLFLSSTMYQDSVFSHFINFISPTFLRMLRTTAVNTLSPTLIWMKPNAAWSYGTS